MHIEHRPYDELRGDFARMWQFLIDDYAVRKDRFVWHIGRLGDWKHGLWSVKKYFPSFMRKNAHLWFADGGALAGFAISENCGSDFAVLAKTGYSFLYADMMRWVKANWGIRGELATEVHEYEEDLMSALEAEGFIRKGTVALTRQYDLQSRLEEPALPEGFMIRDMEANPDYEGKKRLHNNGFGGRTDPVTEFDLLQFEYARENPAYFPRLDLSVIEPGGLHAATCTAFIDCDNRAAEVEKVCSDMDFRRMGLAEAVIRECFRRLAAEGIEYAYITGYGAGAKSLYGKLGAVKSKEWYEYVLGGAKCRD